MYRFTGLQARELCRQVGAARPELACEALVEGLLSECGVEAWPVNLDAIADFMEVSVQYVPQLGFPGYLYRKDGRQVIVINRSDNEKRQRFTYAHELVHAILPPTPHNLTTQREYRLFHLPSHVDEEEEYLCDLGAAHLLLPPRFMHSWFIERRSVLSFSMLEQMSTDFNVSLQACAIGIVKVVVDPVQIVGWGKDQGGFISPYQINVSESFPRDYIIPRQYKLKEYTQLYRFIESDERGIDLNELTIRMDGVRRIMLSRHTRLPNHPTLSLISILRPKPPAPHFPWEKEKGKVDFGSLFRSRLK